MGKTEVMNGKQRMKYPSCHALPFLPVFLPKLKKICVHGNDKRIYFIFSNIKRGNLEEYSIYKNVLTASWDPSWHTCMQAPSMSNASTDCAGALGEKRKVQRSTKCVSR